VARGERRQMMLHDGMLHDETKREGSAMARSTFSSRTVVTLFAACAAAALVAACAGAPVTINDVRYDLGPPPAAATASASTAASGAYGLPPLKVLVVSAPAQLDSDGILFRLGADAQRTGRYAHSRWTMPPARLLTARLRTALGAQATVLDGADAVPAPRLQVELEQFEQVFGSATESYGVLTARATLIDHGKVVAQRQFVVRTPASSPDAAGGVRALAAASDEFVQQIGAWVGMRRPAGTP